MTNQPIQKIRVGAIRASIWENTAEHGVRYSITLTKLYKAANRWQDTGHFDRDDLFLISKVAELAYDWICQQRQTLFPPSILRDLK